MLTTRKAQELEVVELTEDLPEYGLRRGARGAVVAALDQPNEAYDLEFVDDAGNSTIAYSVKPHQIVNLDAFAKEAFEGGVNLLNVGRHAEAEQEFRRAVKIKPDYAGVLHNSLVKSFEGSDDWQRRINAMRLVLRVAPDYQLAKDNLAIAFMNYGVEKAGEGDLEGSRDLYHIALGVAISVNLLDDLRRNLAAAYTGLGLRSYEAGRFEEALSHMGRACAFHPDRNTRRNLGLAYASLGFFQMDSARFEDAINWFEHAEDVGFVSARLLNDYAVALVHIGRIDGAVVTLERALDIEPNNETIRENLAAIRSNRPVKTIVEEVPVAFHAPPPMQYRDYVAA